MVCRGVPDLNKLLDILVSKAQNMDHSLLEEDVDLDGSIDALPKLKLQRPERMMIRITRIKNRFDPEYDASALSGGYRDLSLNVEVGWVKHDKGLEFVPVDEWSDRMGLKRHICEIQIHVEKVFEATGRYHRASVTQGVRNYRTYRDLMSC